MLTTVGEISESAFQERFDEMGGGAAGGAGKSGYHILVILDGTGRIVGTGALIVERKL